MKKGFSLIIALLLILVYCTSAFANPKEQNEEQALREYNDLLRYYAEVEKEVPFDELSVEYPYYFAGAYINDDGYLVVGLTVDDQEIRDEVCKITDNPNILFELMQYSFNDLLATNKRFENELHQHNDGDQTSPFARISSDYFGFGIDVKENRVIISFSEKTSDNIDAVLEVFYQTQTRKMNFSQDILGFEVVEITEAEETTETEHTLNSFPSIYEVSEVRASNNLLCGAKITSNIGNGSVGFRAYANINNKRVEGFVTAAHIAASGVSISYNGTAIGTVRLRNILDCDASFVEITNSNYSMNGQVSGSGVTIDGSGYTTLAVGATAYKSGYETGYTTGTVKQINYTVTISGRTYYDTILCDPMRASNGDSGGIVYASNRKVVGIVIGGPVIGSNKMICQRYWNIYLGLGQVFPY